ncbi:MAG: malate dehydrogenase [Gammaproteobacteria bacterium RIFCSPHIGHO2_12_FULL_35_23]|nr:MAG: malate dehydrogenase [Gammaproteobacteria bacterium RIFCSPHIGHO2_12_FULL_35_23]
MKSKSASAAGSITMRVRINNQPSAFGTLTAKIEELGGQIGAIDISKVDKDYQVRDITIYTSGPEHAEEITNAVDQLKGISVIHVSDRTFLLHLGGKIEIKSKIPLKTRDDLSMAYTPGVARVCMAIHKNPEDVFKLSIKKNTVAVISDGTAVLGLGDIGPAAAMPVMEGKAMLFKEFANVDAFPICLSTKNIDEIVATVKNIATGFGGINLEDIASPRCFEIEERLKKELNIPVFHDDQHGTAVVLTAAMINALKVVKKKPGDIKLVLVGVGAAGVACTKMLLQFGIKNIIGCDHEGVIYKGRAGLDKVKTWYADNTNPYGEKGTIKDVIKGADVFVGVSGPGVLTKADVAKMNKGAIVFAMANPTPEIMPEEAREYATIVATGRSDYPNQINNVLCFPGIFRGALDCLASDINEPMKLAAAYAIANVIDESFLSPDYIVPSVFDAKVVPAVAKAVKEAAIKTGVARKIDK